MADPGEVQQRDEPAVSPPHNRTTPSPNSSTHPPEQTSSTLEITSQAQTQQPTPDHQHHSNPTRPHLPPSQDTPTTASNSKPEDQSTQQPHSPPPMSFTSSSQPKAELQPQPHLRGGCDDEACDCCCCAYTRYGPPPQPMYHRLWYGPPSTG